MSRAPHTYCGPAAVASALGITREEAWLRLKAVRARKSRGWVYVSQVAQVLGTRYESFPKGSRPTVRQWLKANTREAILNAAEHFLHVRDGGIVEDNGYRPLKGKVRHVIPVERKEAAPTAPAVPQVEAGEDAPRRVALVVSDPESWVVEILRADGRWYFERGEDGKVRYYRNRGDAERKAGT